MLYYLPGILDVDINTWLDTRMMTGVKAQEVRGAALDAYCLTMDDQSHRKQNDRRHFNINTGGRMDNNGT